MRRRTFLGIVGSGLLTAPLAAEAQDAGKVWRIGLLDTGRTFAPESLSLHKAFLDGLQEHGYIPGKNVTIEFRGADGKQDRLPALAGELVRLRVDIIVTWGTLPTVAARRATATIPIVMVAVGDPVGTGFASSLARPGGNMTGLSDMNPDLSAKRVQLLRDALPNLARAAVLLNPAHPPNASQLRDTQAAARTLGIVLEILKVQTRDDFEPAFAAAARDRAGAVIVLPDAFTVTHRDRLGELAARYRLPTMFGVRANVAAGGLMAYGASLPTLYQRAATYIDKILKGAKAGDLPIEQAVTFELVINLKTAHALGVTIPPSLLSRADEVIQ